MQAGTPDGPPRLQHVHLLLLLRRAVLEATSRAAAAAADLASGLDASLRLGGQEVQPDNTIAPPRKRCRFVLLSSRKVRCQ